MKYSNAKNCNVTSATFKECHNSHLGVTQLLQSLRPEEAFNTDCSNMYLA